MIMGQIVLVTVEDPPLDSSQFAYVSSAMERSAGESLCGRLEDDPTVSHQPTVRETLGTKRQDAPP